MEAKPNCGFSLHHYNSNNRYKQNNLQNPYVQQANILKASASPSPTNNIHSGYFWLRHCSQTNPNVTLETTTELNSGVRPALPHALCAKNQKSYSKLKDILHAFNPNCQSISPNSANEVSIIIPSQTKQIISKKEQVKIGATPRVLLKSPDILNKQGLYSYLGKSKCNKNVYKTNYIIKALNTSILRCKSHPYNIKSIQHFLSNSKITGKSNNNQGKLGSNVFIHMKIKRLSTVRNLHPIQEYYTCDNIKQKQIAKMQIKDNNFTKTQKAVNGTNLKKLYTNRKDFYQFFNSKRKNIAVRLYKNGEAFNENNRNLKINSKKIKQPHSVLSESVNMNRRIIPCKSNKKCTKNERTYNTPTPNVMNLNTENPTYFLPQISVSQISGSPLERAQTRIRTVSKNSKNSRYFLRKKQSNTGLKNSKTIEETKQKQGESDMNLIRKSCRVTETESIVLLPQMKINNPCIFPLNLSLFQLNFITIQPEI